MCFVKIILKLVKYITNYIENMKVPLSRRQVEAVERNNPPNVGLSEISPHSPF